jgi:hypothetical protein
LQRPPRADHRTVSVHFAISSCVPSPEFKKLLGDYGFVDFWREFGKSDFCKSVGDTDFECI